MRRCHCVARGFIVGGEAPDERTLAAALKRANRGFPQETEGFGRIERPSDDDIRMWCLDCLVKRGETVLKPLSDAEKHSPRVDYRSSSPVGRIDDHGRGIEWRQDYRIRWPTVRTAESGSFRARPALWRPE